MVLRAVVFLCGCVSAASAAADGWHRRLYLGRGGYWASRIAVTVRNHTSRAAAGAPAALGVGRGKGQIDLAGARAESVRVCDAAGTEMLFDVRDAAGVRLRGGAIAAGASITIPVECEAGAAATYYVYFHNPSAWAVGEFLDAKAGIVNGGVEHGSGDAPTGWRHDAPDAEHRTAWVAEAPHAGKRCLKTVVAEGAEATWIATRQGGIHVAGGCDYVLTAWVRAEGVKGSAGWYIHVGNEKNPQLLNRTVSAGSGTFAWKQIRVAFTAPKEANRASLGTVLRGTGRAWFDDVSLSSPSSTGLTAAAGKVESLDVRTVDPPAGWYAGRDSGDWRMSVRVLNVSGAARAAVLAHVDLKRAGRRAAERAAQGLVVYDGHDVVPHVVLPEGLVFGASVGAKTVRTYHVYVGARQGGAPAGGYAALLAGKLNLVTNGSFEQGGELPDGWPGSTEGARPTGTEMTLDTPGRFGKRCVRMHVPHTSKPAWTGWRQSVRVRPGRTYLYAAWLKTKDIRGGSVQLHAHYLDARGRLCRTRQYTGVNVPLRGTNDWRLLSGTFRMPPDCTAFQLHLTMKATGTLWHDGVVLAEVERGLVGEVEVRPEADVKALTAWPVNAVVKVFREDLPGEKTGPAEISAARNEAEPLQLAVRGPRAIEGLRVEVASPVGPGGRRLDDLAVAVVGYVPIDHPTSYYRSESPRWHRKYPRQPGRCDGWAGWWPDPLLPRGTFDLSARTTQPVWVTLRVPKDAPAGVYRGAVRLLRGGEAVHETPFAVRVWDFALPDVSRVKAIYDLRIGRRWRRPGRTVQQTWRRLCRFMAERRLCPDTIHPAPKIAYKDGRVVADFTEFDRAAAFYFDELKLPHAYTPWSFYLFGWGHPPAAKFGEQPYEGTWPFEGADRRKLRPAFKRAYQACLKAFWDHLKAKGWADRCMLYISDEPHFRHDRIREQMIALCEMIHEVDAKIPIYSSTWDYVPAWDGQLNVWGIGHYGRVPVKRIADLKARGRRVLWTTDGQMCTDTPYCAVERLLPHYCVQYGAEGYEFWGITWLTHDPYEYGWHRYIPQSSEPGTHFWVRYPNGDGFLAYPGGPIGHDGPVSSVRLEQAREGVEDAEYLLTLRDLAAKTKAAGRDASRAERALAAAGRLVPIPNAGGRYSTKILPDPDAVLRVRRAVAEAIESLKGDRQHAGGAKRKAAPAAEERP